MKFLHIADVHLGASPDISKPWGKNRNKEIWSTFERVIRIANDNQVDLLLIAGDLFHRQPLQRELSEVNYLFSTLARTQVVLIAGNHDYISETSSYNTFQWNPNVHFIKEAQMTRLSLKIPNCIRSVDVYGFSYHTQEIPERRYDAVPIANRSAINILLGHGGDDTHCPYSLQTVARLGFQYLAFGHIHKAGVSEKIAMANVGSLEPLNCNETGAHGYILGQIDENTGRCAMKYYSICSRRYVDLTIQSNRELTTRSLTDQIHRYIVDNGEQNIYNVTLEGIRNGDVTFDKEYILTAGNILLTDHTIPDFDYERILDGNRDNLIGQYISRMRQEPMDDTKKKALYYGVKALMDAMEVRE